MIISVSGLDGAGKGTQILYIKKHLEKHGFKVFIKWARPGYTPILEFLKKHIFKKLVNKKQYHLSYNFNSKIKKTDKILSFLYLWISFIDLVFFWLIYCRIRSLLGWVIILDRYTIDAEIDFILKYPEFKKSLWIVKRILKNLPNLSASLYLNISWKVSLERSKKKKDPYIESTFRLKLKEQKYHDIISEYSFIMMDASKTEEEVSNDISNTFYKLNLIS